MSNALEEIKDLFGRNFKMIDDLYAENKELRTKLAESEEKLRKRTQEFDEEMSDFLEGYGLILKENNELKERRDGPVHG